MTRRPPRPQRDWAYFFDVDGTLIDFGDTPVAVHVTEDVRQLLEQLHAQTGGAVALITGRSIAAIDRLFPHARMPVAGQHGAEWRDAAGHISHHALPIDRLEGVRSRMAHAAAAKPGLFLEDKGMSLALHYRRAPRFGAYAHRLARALLPIAGPEFCVQRGKYVVEMRPAGRDKGIAVREFMKQQPFAHRVPVFVGDDATDEFGFATVNGLGGHSIKVGPGRTAARWRLRNVQAVEQWLRSISR